MAKNLVVSIFCVLCVNSLSYKTAPANFLAANPNINLDIPVISKFTPTSVPIAHTELDGQ